MCSPLARPHKTTPWRSQRWTPMMSPLTISRTMGLHCRSLQQLRSLLDDLSCYILLGYWVDHGSNLAKLQRLQRAPSLAYLGIHEAATCGQIPDLQISATLCRDRTMKCISVPLLRSHHQLLKRMISWNLFPLPSDLAYSEDVRHSDDFLLSMGPLDHVYPCIIYTPYILRKPAVKLASCYLRTKWE